MMLHLFIHVISCNNLLFYFLFLGVLYSRIVNMLYHQCNILNLLSFISEFRMSHDHDFNSHDKTVYRHKCVLILYL